VIGVAVLAVGATHSRVRSEDRQTPTTKKQSSLRRLARERTEFMLAISATTSSIAI
jgi:hypothetical protein